MSMDVRRRSVVINGQLVSGEDVNIVCKRKGLCPSCGEVKTHQRKRKGLVGFEMTPLTVKNYNGDYAVYKGYCIRPLCYSLDQAKRELGEVTATTNPMAYNRNDGAPSSVRSRSSAGSDENSGSRDNDNSSTYGGSRSTRDAGAPSSFRSRSSVDSDEISGSRRSRNSGGSQIRRGVVREDSFNSASIADDSTLSSHDISTGGRSSEFSFGASSSRSFNLEPRRDGKGNVVLASYVPGSSSRSITSAGSHRNLGGSSSIGSFRDRNHHLSRETSSGSYDHLKILAGRATDSDTSTSSNTTKTKNRVQSRRYTGDHRPASEQHLSSNHPRRSSFTGNSFRSPVHDSIQEQQNESLSKDNSKRVSFNDDPPETSGYVAPVDVKEIKPVIRELEKYAKRGDYSSLVDKLCSEWNDADVVEKAFKLMRNGIHVLDDGYVFSSSTWVKYTITAMENQSKRGYIQAQGILMLWTLCTLSPRYMKDVSKGSCVGAVVGIMNRYKMEDDVLEYSCGFLECLTSNEKDGMGMKHAATRQAIPALVRTIRESNNSVARERAMRAIYNFSQQDNTNYTGYSLVVQVQNAIAVGGQGMAAITKLIENEKTQEWGIWLVQGIFSSSDGSSGFFSGEDSGILNTLINLTHSQDVNIQQAAFDMISAKAISAGKQGDHLSEEIVKSAVESVIVAMSVHRSKPDLQLSAIGLLLNFCTDSHQCSKLAHMDVVPALLEALHVFGNNAHIQGAACLALSYLCIHDEGSKLALVENRGVDELCEAFHTFVANEDQSSYPPEAIEQIKNGVCAALTSLTASNDTISAVKKSGIFWEMDIMTKEGDNSEMRVYVHTMFQNILASTWRLDEQLGSDYQTTIDMVMKHLKTTSQEREASHVIALLFDLSLKSTTSMDNVLSSDNGRAMNIILKTMEAHPNSADVQRFGCALLANIYVRLHYDGKLNQRTSLTLGTKAFDIETHTEREVKVLSAAMNNHKGNAQIQEYGCDALANFITGANSPEDASEIEATAEVSRVYCGVLKIVVDALSIHETSPFVIKSACRLFSVIVFLDCGDDLRRMGPHATSKLLETMSGFPKDEELQSLACNVFVSLVEDEESGRFLGEEDSIRSLLACFKFENESLSASAAEILVKILKTNFLASNYFMEIEDSIESVVLSMMRHSQSAPVQHFTCSLLSALAALHEDFVKGMIASGGGLNAIQNAMTNHQNNPTVMASACTALGTIMSGVHPTLIVNQTAAIFSLIMSIMRTHKSDSKVNAAAILTLNEICDRDPTFRETIGDMQGIPTILGAMTQFLENEELQLHGISVLWKMASYEPNKKRIGSSGIRATINGMLFHIKSTLVQQEAMTALKNLGTTSAGKRDITEFGGVTAIVSSMWVNMHNKIVLCGAYSALNNIAIDSETRKVAVAENGELPPICFGMKRYPLEEDLQRCAVFLLKTYTFAPSNIEMMKCEEYLPSLLTAAAQNFPHECGDRADYVLSRI